MINRGTVKQALRIDVAMSSEMANALELWASMYGNNPPWVNSSVRSLNLPAAISGEIARAATIEARVEISGSARADWLSVQFERVMDALREQVEKGAAKGGLIFKPYVSGANLAIDYVQADMFYPVKFDASGRISAAVFADQRQDGDNFYTRLEYHELTSAGYIIRNQAYKSSNRDNLGQPVDLSVVGDWAELQPEAMITGIDRPLFAYFRFPQANNIDPASPLGVSCYSRAVEQIEQADRLWSDFLWEFESGQRALYADVASFKKDKDGNPILPHRRLYRTLDMGGTNDSLFEEWTPTLRQAEYLAGLDAILKRIEFSCGLAYGVLSNPQTVDKTATEIKISRQRTYATISDTQKALKVALEDLLYAMDIWATLYRLAPSGAFSVAFQWDDSVIVDKDAQFQQDLRLVSQGLMSKTEFRMRNFGEDEKTARAKIAEVQAERPQEADMFQGA